MAISEDEVSISPPDNNNHSLTSTTPQSIALQRFMQLFFSTVGTPVTLAINSGQLSSKLATVVAGPLWNIVDFTGVYPALEEFKKAYAVKNYSAIAFQKSFVLKCSSSISVETRQY